jgi:hypothetical protein
VPRSRAISVAPCQTLTIRFEAFAVLVSDAPEAHGRRCSLAVHAPQNALMCFESNLGAVLCTQVGVITESNAEKAIEELKAYQADLATVLRGKRLRVIPACELVPGDIVEVAVGAKVPCDCRLISIFSSQLRCDQSILTGESNSMQKDLAPCSLRGVSGPLIRAPCCSSSGWKT